MAWKCPQCGFMHDDPATVRCEACGFTRHGKVVLVAEETSGRIGVSVDTPVGKTLLKSFAGSDHVYAGEPQFVLARDLVAGGWSIAPAAGAKNPTFLNGAPLGDAPAPVRHGATITIGPTRLRLRVENEL